MIHVHMYILDFIIHSKYVFYMSILHINNEQQFNMNKCNGQMIVVGQNKDLHVVTDF